MEFHYQQFFDKAIKDFTYDHRATYTKKLENKTDIFISGESELEKINKIINNPDNTHLIKKFGFLDKDPNKVVLPTYTLNKFGYRCNEFNTKEDRIVTLGCSDTFGAYQYQERTWPYLLAKKVDSKVWNLGSCGASIQSCYYTFKAIESKIKFSDVFILIPNPTRFAFYNYKKSWKNVHGDHLDEFITYFNVFDELGFDEQTIKELKIYFTLMCTDEKWQGMNITTYLDAIRGIASQHNARVHYLFNWPFFPHPYTNGHVSKDVFVTKALDLRHSGYSYQEQVSELFYNELVGNSDFSSYI